MRGVLRPCRTHLGPDLHRRWQAHLCGLCLTLRDVAGQPERALTGYDVLLLSVLVEAQAGSVATSAAGPCPLRGFRPATVVASSSPAGQLAAAGALLSAAAGLADKLEDGDLPRAARRPAVRVAGRLERAGAALAGALGLDPAPVLGAPVAAARAEHAQADLPALLAPTGAAVAALFAHTATTAGHPENVAALADCGDAFGRLVHLLDAVEDLAGDEAAGRFNPLLATRTDALAARALADALVAQVRAALDRVVLADRALVDVLLRTELASAVRRALPPPQVPRQRAPGSGTLVALFSLALPAVFIGGWSSGGGRRRRRRRQDPYGYSSGHRRVGPSCSQLLACNCCANLACNTCCCGSDCADA